MRRLVEQLAITAELMGQQLSPVAITAMAQDLSVYPLEVCIEALNRLRRESKGRMTLAAVIEQVERLQPDGRPGADEAWAMIPKDEFASAVLNQEMAEALAIAQPLLDEGDKIAARMAFKDAYCRIVERNKLAGVAPKWHPSLGQDPHGREAALRSAVQLGRLTAEHAASLLPAPQDGIGIAAALIGNAPLRLEATCDAAADKRALTDVRGKLAGMRVAIGRRAA